MISTHEPAILCACVGIVAAGALCDFFTRRIPNLLTLGGFILGIGYHGSVGFVERGVGGGLRGIGLALLGAILCAIVPTMSFNRGEMGGGDVKLFAAIGAMAGLSLGIDAQAITFIFAALILWPWRLAKAGKLRAFGAQIVAKVLRRSEKLDAIKVAPVVLGPSIFLGLCVSLLRHGVLL
jgi:prepilin peptidase CpaA